MTIYHTARAVSQSVSPSSYPPPCPASSPVVPLAPPGTMHPRGPIYPSRPSMPGTTPTARSTTLISSRSDDSCLRFPPWRYVVDSLRHTCDGGLEKYVGKFTEGVVGQIYRIPEGNLVEKIQLSARYFSVGFGADKPSTQVDLLDFQKVCL